MKTADIILGMGSDIKKRCYIVTLSIIGYAYIQNDLWNPS